MYDQDTGLVTRKSHCSAGGHLETQMSDTGDVYCDSDSRHCIRYPVSKLGLRGLPSAMTRCDHLDPVVWLAVM